MLTVNEIMTTLPITIDPEMKVSEAAEIMSRESCQHLPVLDGQKLVGILSDRDIRLAKNSALFHSATTESCMTYSPITITADTSAEQAAELLALYKIGSLPVVENGNLVGIVTVNDFLKHFHDDQGTYDWIEPVEESPAKSYNGWNLING